MADVEIPMDVLRRYTDGVHQISDAARQDMAFTLANVDLSDRELVEDLVAGACRFAQEASAQYAAQFYRGLSILQTGADFDAKALSDYDRTATLIAVRGIYRQATRDGELDEDELAGLLGDRIAYEVNRASKVSVWRNGQRDSRDVRYARVPVGAETCAWCIMTAGLGYWYMSEEAASHTHSHCVVGDTEVYGSGLLASMRREYEGPLVSLSTSKGRNLTVTPDHPILTTLGWKRAGDLVEGDNLVCAPFVHGHGAGIPDVHDAPPTAKEVFEASHLIDAALLDGMPAATKDLYRKMFPDGDVNVVSPDGLLQRAVEAAFGEPSEHERFASAGELDALACLALDGDGALCRLLGSGLPSACGDMRRGGLGGALLGSHGRCAQESSLGASAMIESGVTDPAVHDSSTHPEAPSDGVDAFAVLEGFERASRWGDDLLARLDACALQRPIDGGGADAEFLRDVGRPCSAPIEVDNLVSLSVSEGNCHVYNLSTRGGWYVSSGIITHNCDCQIVASIGRGDVRIKGYDSTVFRDMWRTANKLRANGSIPQEWSDHIAQVHAQRDREERPYRDDTNGTLYVMRKMYDLK